ncbi:MAG: SusC/RagA family TonB-linked outer membrane protein, partial [Bacteroidota bacterium]|nr:SusC/RagA family TonB-linked outer membrane protein [Candidatus Kapabacteria bacterium]MDW8219330.1 SusC/RagA family TonB-linked outer membrane protein [Bacteroidota bacterium]
FNPVRNEAIDWRFRLNFLQVRQQIVSLGGVPAYNTGGFGQALGTFRIEEGLPPTTMIGVQTRIVNNTVDRSTIAGDAQPNFNLAFSNDLRIGDFTFYFLIDHQNGGLTVNLTRFLTDNGRITPDGIRAQRARLIANARKTQWIEDATHTRLREASIMYNLSRETLSALFGEAVPYARIGVTGRNLYLWTNYSGYDPEVSNFGNVAIGGNIEVTPFPSSRAVFLTIQFGL